MNPIFYSPRLAAGVGTARPHVWLSALLLLLLFLAGGCLSKPPLAKQSFAFPLPPVPTNQNASAADVLELRQVSVAAPFDSQSFIYRTGPYSYERDPYAEFLVSPEEAFRPLLVAYLRDSGLFRQVTGRDELGKPDSVALVKFTELYGDFRNPSAPMAVVRMNFVLFDRRSKEEGRPLLNKEYIERVPFSSRTAAALMRSWNQAIERLMSAVAADLKSAFNAPAHTGSP